MQVKPISIPTAKATARKAGPLPPKGLSVQARRLWRQLSEGFDISDPAGLSLLEVAVRSFDRALEARRILDAEGLIILDRFRQRKMHPAFMIERDSRAMMMRALKALNLDLEPLNAGVGRPAGG